MLTWQEYYHDECEKEKQQSNMAGQILSSAAFPFKEGDQHFSNNFEEIRSKPHYDESYCKECQSYPEKCTCKKDGAIDTDKFFHFLYNSTPQAKQMIDDLLEKESDYYKGIYVQQAEAKEQEPFKPHFEQINTKKKVSELSLYQSALKTLQQSIVNPAPEHIKPSYYKAEINGVEIDVIDIIKAFGLSFTSGNALKYIIRAGKKVGESKSKDISKAVENLQREING